MLITIYLSYKTEVMEQIRVLTAYWFSMLLEFQ